MRCSVFDQVPDRIRNRVGIPFHVYGLVGPAEGDHPVSGQSPWSHVRNDARGYFIEVYCPGNVQSDRIQPGDAQQLLNQPIHARYIRFDFDQLLIAVHRVECPGDNRERRAQLVCSVRRELPLNGEALFQAVEGAVHGGDKRCDFARKIALG